MSELVNRRFMLPDGKTFRVVADVDAHTVLAGRKGQQAQRMSIQVLRRAVETGAVTDITSGRPCPACGAVMNREVTRIEWWADRVINKFMVRDQQVRKHRHGAVWFCNSCEHAEEEK